MAAGGPEASYAPGSWVAIAGPSAWLLAELDPTADPTVTTCWTLLRDGAPVEDVLDALVSVGFRVLPGFALAWLDGAGGRILVRGTAQARAVGPDGAERLVRSAGARTWTDQVVGGGLAVLELVAGEGVTVGRTLPLPSGVGMASALRVTFGAAPPPGQVVEVRRHARRAGLPAADHPGTAAAAPAPADPGAVGPGAAVPGAAAPVAVGPVAAGPVAAGPGAVGPSAVSPGVADRADADPAGGNGTGIVGLASPVPEPSRPVSGPRVDRPDAGAELEAPNYDVLFGETRRPDLAGPVLFTAEPDELAPDRDPGLVPSDRSAASRAEPDLSHAAPPGVVPTPQPDRSASSNGTVTDPAEPIIDAVPWDVPPAPAAPWPPAEPPFPAALPAPALPLDPATPSAPAPPPASAGLWPPAGPAVLPAAAGPPPPTAAGPDGPGRRRVPDPVTGDGAEAAMATIDRSRLPTPDGDAVAGPAVLAVRCPAGHLSPANAGYCRVCRAGIPAQEPVRVARPPLGVLRLSTGDVVALDRGVVLGRAPEGTELPAADRPHVVRLAHAGGDVSRAHVEVSLDGWHVLVKDLHSTNGTTVIPPGRAPTRLRPADPVLIEPGTEVSLADGIGFRYEVTG